MQNQNKVLPLIQQNDKDMKTYAEYKDLQGKQNEIVNQLSNKLNTYPKGAFGLIDDSVRMSEDFKNTNSSYRIEFNKLRSINQIGMKKFKKEIQKAHNEKRKNRA